MSHSLLLQELTSGVWAMLPEAVAGFEQQVRATLARQGQDTQVQDEAALMQSADFRVVTTDDRRMSAGKDPITAESGMVVVVNISGPILKHDDYRTPGANTISRWLAEIEDTPEFLGAVLNIDSPGGSTYAMLALTQQLESMKKPVVSFIQHGMACSAAYGIAAATNLILSASDLDTFGSIGTYVRIQDRTKAEADQGIVTHTVMATRSKAKDRPIREVLKADPSDPEDKHYQLFLKSYLDPVNEHFISMVQRHRPGLKDENGVFEGEKYMAQDALKYGLIDGTGKTMQDAIESVRAMSKKPTTP